MKLLSWLFGKVDTTPIILSRIWYPKKQDDLFPELDENVFFKDHVLEKLDHIPFSWITEVHGVVLLITSKQLQNDDLKAFRQGIWNDLLTKISPPEIPLYIVYSPNAEGFYSKIEIMEALGLARYQFSPLFIHYDLTELDEFLEVTRLTAQALKLDFSLPKEE